MAPDKPSLVIGQENTLDPFVTSGPATLNSGNHNHSNVRYSGFDGDSFALGPGASPTSAKRALEAHLADTQRRLNETSKLGTALVQQQEELTARLEEVEQLRAEDELPPDLRSKLTALEKDFREVATESARALLPKHRVPSSEANPGTPFTPSKDVVRRSMSPSKFDSHKFESMATGSPSKFSVPNRKMRNQPANRIHDIEFAADISTSLIAQVRRLQAILQEREEEVKDLKSGKLTLEAEVQSFQQRVRDLDESESRYKDENWTLETQIQDYIAKQKEAADREKKLSHALSTLQADKNATQRDLDEVRAAHSKLLEDHAAAAKHHDIELGTAKRNAVMAEAERAALQRKIDELTSQNQELAKAISVERGRTSQRNSPSGSSEDDLENASGNLTPEHSPPPSPIKPTPRHSMLETETLKTSLQHAQRTIQSLRTNVHREKTEKLELKRMLQDARDEIEKLRSDPVERPHQRRAREAKSREFKKPPKLDKLGTARAVKAEIFEDPEWEDASVRGPPLMLARMTGQADIPIPSTETDEFETANEAHESTDAFETAHERGGTETEAFQTGAEDFDSEDTEIESPSRRARAARASALKKAPIFASSSQEYTYESTASTSASEDEDYMDPTSTPSSQPRRVRVRAGHGQSSRRFSRQLSEEPGFQGSPASQISQTNRSFSSAHSLPRQSLFAELGDLEGSDEGSTVGTPGQRSLRSVTPASTTRGMTASPRSVVPPVPAMPRVITVDSGMMTEPVDLLPIAATVGSERAMSTDSVTSAAHARPLSNISEGGTDTEGRLAQIPWPSQSPAAVGGIPGLNPTSVQQLSVSAVYSEEVVPRAEPGPEPAQPHTLRLSSVCSEHVEPVAEPEVAPPSLSLSHVVAEGIDPVAEPEVPPPPPPRFSVSPVVVEQVEPVAELEKPLPPPPALQFSQISSAETEPVAEPEPEPRVVTVVEYRDAPQPPPADLTFSPISSAETEPVAEPEPEPRVLTVVEYRDTPKPPPAVLTFTTISSAEVEPVAEPEPEPQIVRVVEYVEAPQLPPAELSFSAISSADVEPVALPEPEPRVVRVVEYVEAPHPPPAQLSYSSLVSEGIEPQAEPQPLPPTLTVSSIATEHVVPEPEPKLPQPALSVSSIVSEHIEPKTETSALPPPLSLSQVLSEQVEPVNPVASKAVFGKPLLPSLGFSAIESLATEPTSLKTDAFITSDEEQRLVTLTKDIAGSTPLRKPEYRDAVVIAEDDTRQFLNASTETPESQRPVKVISARTNANPSRKAPAQTSDSGAQTSLTAETIDQMLEAKNNQTQPPASYRPGSTASADGMSTPDTVRVRSSQESLNNAHRSKGKVADMGIETVAEVTLRRPSSAAGARSPTKNMPPLPLNHREVIEAARTGTANSGHGTIGSMGPPLFPASAYKNPMTRPRTPMSVSSRHGDPTPRPERLGVADVHSPTRSTAKSRKSSVSSFASEVDHRFNMTGGMADMEGSGFGPNTDPRMIQAITQTMIGEYLWKYTRKTGRDEMSENRHRRYFWVQPYSRTLNWSDRNPSSPGRSEARSKSVLIEAVRVVTDDNPMPPGLHRKSLIILTPGRSVKFTCTTGQRHETWFNALSYLLLRTDGECHADTEEMVSGITRDEVEEFNPPLGRRNTAGTGARGAPSISSYNSRGTRQEVSSINLDVPTLTPTPKKAISTTNARPSFAGRFSEYLKSKQDSLSLRGRSGFKDQHSLYSNEVHDSAEDLREMYERQDRESDRLDNVRACCDGKHDVGTLTKKRGPGSHSPSQAHLHAHPSRASTPATFRSGA